MGEDTLYHCLVCGLRQDEPPWGEHGDLATFNICYCRGTTFGYQDVTPVAVQKQRARWLAGGARWFEPKEKPANWSLQEQLASVPEGHPKEGL